MFSVAFVVCWDWLDFCEDDFTLELDVDFVDAVEAVLETERDEYLLAAVVVLPAVRFVVPAAALVLEAFVVPVPLCVEVIFFAFVKSRAETLSSLRMMFVSP